MTPGTPLRRGELSPAAPQSFTRLEIDATLNGGADSAVVSFGTALDPMHPAIRRDEHDVERDQRVLHPHGGGLGRVVEKQHPGIFRQRAAKHQAKRAVLVGGGHFDIEAVIAGFGLEHERGRARRQVARRAERKREQTRRSDAGEPVDPARDQCEDGPCEPSGLSSAAISPFGT